MSTTTNIVLEQAIVTEKNISDKLRQFDYDEDINGNNGPEYLSDEAKKRGFECELDMIFEDAEKKTKKMKGEKKINAFADEILNGLLNHGGAFYEGSEVFVLKIDSKKFVVSILMHQTT